MAIGFGCLRFLGQGSLMLNCGNLTSQWFDRKRGLALGLMSLGFPISIALHPPLTQWLIAEVGWREAWIWLGVITWVTLIPPALLFLYNRPEDVGLRPDGDAALAAGVSHSLALTSDGRVWAWGDNEYGQITGSSERLFVPEPIAGLSDVVAIAAGWYHSLAVTSDGSVWAWGDNSRTELGTPLGLLARVPIRVVGVSGAVAVTAGWGTSYVLLSDGSVLAWGANGVGEAGDGLPVITPTPAVTLLRDLTPLDMGNVLLAVRSGTDVVIAVEGAPARAFRFYRDNDKLQLGTTDLLPDSFTPGFTDVGATGSPDDLFYVVRGLSPCGLQPGP